MSDRKSDWSIGHRGKNGVQSELRLDYPTRDWSDRAIENSILSDSKRSLGHTKSPIGRINSSIEHMGLTLIRSDPSIGPTKSQPQGAPIEIFFTTRLPLKFTRLGDTSHSHPPTPPIEKNTFCSHPRACLQGISGSLGQNRVIKWRRAIDRLSSLVGLNEEAGERGGWEIHSPLISKALVIFSSHAGEKLVTTARLVHK